MAPLKKKTRIPSCIICGAPTAKIFEKKVLTRHVAEYYQCTNCNHIQVSPVTWLKEAYAKAIAALDLGLLSRNLFYAPVVETIIERILPQGGRFLDYGGGYGLFTRLMRDRGFDFHRQDSYCENIFALDFDFATLHKSERRFDLITLFEVVEHLPNPSEEVQRLLQYSDTLLFSTELVPGESKDIIDWWYISPETGQHISFFTLESMEILAERFGLKLYSNRRNLHLLTKDASISDPFPYLERKFGNSGWRWWYSRIINKLRAIGVIRAKQPRSLLAADYEAAVHKSRERRK